MATKEMPPTPPASPVMAVTEWVRQHGELPLEAAAGFITHCAHDLWDTADHWAVRWDAWFHSPRQKGAK